jgi:hypothetical protein
MVMTLLVTARSLGAGEPKVPAPHRSDHPTIGPNVSGLIVRRPDGTGQTGRRGSWNQSPPAQVPALGVREG